MTALIVLLLVGLGFLWWQKSQGVAIPAPLIGGLAALAVVLSVWKIVVFQTNSSQTVIEKSYRGAAYEIGRALAADLPAGGEVLVIQLPDPTMGASGVPEGQLAGLAAGMGRKFKIVKCARDGELQAPWEQAFSGSGPHFAPALARALLKRHSGVAAVVSFFGLPGATAEEGWDPAAPPLYALGSWDDVKKTGWLSSDRLKMLVTPRQVPAGESEPGDGPEKAYDLYYERVK